MPYGYWQQCWSRTSSNFIDDTEIEVQRRRMPGWLAAINHRELVGTNTLDLRLVHRNPADQVLYGPVRAERLARRRS
ncbi:ShlB/FhaC/HecB family hemolysin secretion/activation protein [Pseudomonas vanderleydeniana]|uniref:ShlB/FhaC/HecB family hemolysin secretion/activation protein n=1 Tax=Pseudomonas vanderleydeniana TaxID=2745495 RepID=UPI001CEDCA9A|nr:ShlB/FhaC/HecB family hemolysin secretion/activation protein [Pseudomonas vanderleydeniana]